MADKVATDFLSKLKAKGKEAMSWFKDIVKQTQRAAFPASTGRRELTGDRNIGVTGRPTIGGMYLFQYDAKWKENWAGNMMPIRNKCQFSWFCDGKSDEPLDTKTWMLSLIVARDVMDGFYGDITEGATHYHNVYVNPYWADSLNETVVINEHIFYK